MVVKPERRNVDSHREILAKAALRAAKRLKMRNVELAQVLGVSEATISNVDRHRQPLPNDVKKLEIATLFIRLYRSLDAIVGGDDDVAAEWLRHDNSALNAKPIDSMKTLTGLYDVVAYLDARRALV